jgi:glycosyltransferase involved in cell wall biosynthesis
MPSRRELRKVYGWSKQPEKMNARPKKPEIREECLPIQLIETSSEDTLECNSLIPTESYEFLITSSVKNSIINTYFDKVFLVNLDRREDRLTKIKNDLDLLGIKYERFSAIDGQTLDQKIVDNYKLPLGAIGCLLSHYEIIKISKDRGYKRILILEDDVLFSDSFYSQFIERFSELPSDWKMVYLGASQYKKNLEFFNENLYYSKDSLGTFAYAVDCSIFDDILSTNYIDSVPIDNILAIIQEKNYGKCFTIYPNIIIADVRESDIRGNRDQESHSKVMEWDKSDFGKTPYFSIIIPNHNSPHIQKTIESVENQSFKDFECIIVNDCKSEELVCFSNNIKVVDRPDYLNQNANSCRNYGINLSKGKYLIFLDSDDLLDADCLLNRKSIIEQNPGYENYIFKITRFRDIPKDLGYSLVNKNQILENPLDDFLNYNILWHTTSSTWKKETLQKIGGFNEDLDRLQDVDIHIRYLANTNKTYIDHESEPDSFYRISGYHSNLTKEKKDKIVSSTEKMINSYKNTNIKLKENFIRFIENRYGKICSK